MLASLPLLREAFLPRRGAAQVSLLPSLLLGPHRCALDPCGKHSRELGPYNFHEAGLGVLG